MLDAGIDADEQCTKSRLLPEKLKRRDPFWSTEEGKQMVLAVTLTDGNNVKYLIKLPQADKLPVTKEATPNEKISSWEIEKLGTALSTGDNPLPLGIDLKISQVAVQIR